MQSKPTLKSFYRQIHREVRWVLYLTCFYILGWAGCAYLPSDTQGWLGFPLWFELSCLYFPTLFILVCYGAIKLLFKEIPLDEESL